jgi:hypothetical protein
MSNKSKLTSIHQRSEYDHRKHFFVNSYPWLFPSGIGDIYDLERGEVPINEWGQHLLQYYDGQFLEDSLFDYFCIIPSRDTQITARAISSLNLIASLVKPTIYSRIEKTASTKNTHYIQMLRSFSRNKKGSDNYWRSRTKDLRHWIMHHVARGHAPPTFFITLSCAENWWIDLKCLLA